MEIDGLSVLMNAVRAGHAATMQPGAAVALVDSRLSSVEIADAHAYRRNVLATLTDDELSSAVLATRLIITEVAQQLVIDNHWPGATWIHGET